MTPTAVPGLRREPQDAPGWHPRWRPTPPEDRSGAFEPQGRHGRPEAPDRMPHPIRTGGRPWH
jgi:hypothetical protein